MNETNETIEINERGEEWSLGVIGRRGERRDVLHIDALLLTS
jgi:hypothetical protein